MPSKAPFFPWHTSFGRTVATDVIVPTYTDDIRIMLRSVVRYEEARGNSMLLRVEVLHQDDRHPVEVSVDGEPAKGMRATDDGFRSLADLWSAPAPDGEFSVTVSYGGTSAEAVVTPS